VDATIIALSVPFFFLLIGAELVVARLQGLDAHRFDDSVTDISCGLGQSVTNGFYIALTLIGYAWVHEHAALASLDGTVAWVVAIVGVDLLYYWWHRASHRVNAIWATHVVHHQSQEYNLAVALRQSWFTSATTWVFYLPLAVLGVPVEIYAASVAINTVGQFWFHTRTVGRLGPLEWVLNTPSHHRVHHGINPEYIDKNYAGLLIVWDRLFGTFAAEVDEPVYGTVKPLESRNPVWAQVEVFVDLARRCRDYRGLDRLRVWLAPPEWTPTGTKQIPSVERATHQPYRPEQDTQTWAYVGLHFLPVGAASTGVLLLQATAPLWAVAALAAWVVVGTVAFGGLFERRAWAVRLEQGRLAAAVAVLAAWAWVAPAPAVTAALVAAVGITAASGLFLRRQAWAAPSRTRR
jgi:alkylglycerol monooxygenase